MNPNDYEWKLILEGNFFVMRLFYKNKIIYQNLLSGGKK